MARWQLLLRKLVGYSRCDKLLRFSANLGFLWPEISLPDRVDAASKAGFKAIELHWPYETPAHAVRAKCEANGLKLLGVNTSRGNASKGELGLGALPGRQADFQASFDQSLRYCVEGGGNAIHCLAGKMEPAARDVARSALSHELNLVARIFEAPVRAQAAAAARHVWNASSRRTRSVRRDVRWRWTLNVFWTAA
jgi:hydroxypyruvate isomerase